MIRKESRLIIYSERIFQSFIVKESNTYDRDIGSYRPGVNALLESEKIKEIILLFEHDLWHFLSQLI